MGYWSFPAISKSEDGKERLFVGKGTRGSSGPPGEAASINQLCAFIEKSSLTPTGAKPQPDAGVTGNGAAKVKRSSGGWAEDKGRTSGWDGDTDERAGGGKGRHKRGWKGEKVQKKRSALADEASEDASPDYVPNKRRSDNRVLRKATQPSGVYTQPDQRVRGTGPGQRGPITPRRTLSLLDTRTSSRKCPGKLTPVSLFCRGDDPQDQGQEAGHGR